MTTENEAGVGCRQLATVLGALLGFAAGAAVLGLGLLGNDSCVGLCEGVAFTAYGAGLPVSAAFTAVTANDLIVAYLTDAIAWIVVAVVATRWVERRRTGPWRAVSFVVGVAIIYGALIGLLLERA